MLNTSCTCTFCQRQLTGGSDTYGDIDEPICFMCWCRESEEHGRLVFPEELDIFPPAPDEPGAAIFYYR